MTSYTRSAHSSIPCPVDWILINAHCALTEMLSAIQGKFSTTKVNPWNGLHSPVIVSRCAHVKSCIATLNIKELHQFFPYLLSNIFGFDHKGGWGLHSFSKTLHSDFTPIKQFLAPSGELFHLIAKLDADNLIYEFPVRCLPKPSQQALAEGIVPSFYTNKVQLSFSIDNAPTHIFLSAFEYYFFHFAYFLIDAHQNKWSQAPVNVAESLYTHLFEAYLSHYLPFTGTVPSPLGSTPTKGSPIYQHPGITPPSEGGFGNLHGHRYKLGDGVSPDTRGGLSPTEDASHQEIGVVHTETFVQILVEFWLNQNTYNGSQGDLLSREQTRFFPSEEQLLLLRRFLKQVHYFSNGYTYNAAVQASLSIYLPITEALRSSVVATYLQKKFYNFLKHSVKHSSLDFSFRNIIELWLTFIQPWRYLDPSKDSAENKESLKTYQDKWRVYVLENFPFYSTLLILFLSRCSQADLISNVNHIIFIYRVSKVFSQPKLREFIERGEHLLFSPNPSSLSPQMGSPRAAASNIKAVFGKCEGAMVQYNSLFEQDTIEMVQLIVMKVRQAKSFYTQKIHQSTQQQQQHQPHPLTPSTPPSPTLSLTPPHTPQSFVGNQPVKRSWLKSAWNGLVELFSEDPVHSVTSSTPSMATNPKKLVEFLAKIEENLLALFQPQLLSHQSMSMSHGGSPVLSKSTPHLAMSQSFSGHTPPSTPPSSITPEYLQGEHRLSPRGKMQVIQGLRKCSNLHVEYMGDPLLQPIRSFENATLVRALYQLSCSLNDKFASRLAALGTSNRLTSKLLLQLLAPPPPAPYVATVVADQHIDQPPATPTTRVSSVILPPAHGTTLHSIPSLSPRINLRPLGSYYTLTYLTLGCFLAWLLSVPLWLGLLLLLCFLLLYCIFSYMLTNEYKNRSNKIKM